MSDQLFNGDENSLSDLPGAENSISEEELALLFGSSEMSFELDLGDELFGDQPQVGQIAEAPHSTETAEEKSLSQAEIDALIASMRGG